MRIGRLRTADGVVHARRTETGWAPVEDPYEALAQGREPADLGGEAAGELLPPCEPLVVVGIAQNGPEHHSPVQAWLKSPRKFADGTKMTFAGLGNAEERANVIAYLNQQGSNLPLPAAPAEGASDARPATGNLAAVPAPR